MTQYFMGNSIFTTIFLLQIPDSWSTLVDHKKLNGTNCKVDHTLSPVKRLEAGPLGTKADRLQQRSLRTRGVGGWSQRKTHDNEGEILFQEYLRRILLHPNLLIYFSRWTWRSALSCPWKNTCLTSPTPTVRTRLCFDKRLWWQSGAFPSHHTWSLS